jgi:hypothetical protein
MYDVYDYDVLWPAVHAPVAQVPTVQAPVAHALQNPLPQLVLPMSVKDRVANIETRGNVQHARAIPRANTNPPVAHETEVQMFDIRSHDDEDADNEGDVPSNCYGDDDDSDDDWPQTCTPPVPQSLQPPMPTPVLTPTTTPPPPQPQHQY